MSILSNLTNIAGSVSALSNSISNLGNPFNTPTWLQQLQPASFRGVPFNAKTYTNGGSRKNIIHEYYGSNRIMVEDAGLGVQTVEISGFLIGPNVYAQRNALLGAVDAGGAGVLIHPSLGKLNANVMSFTFSEEVGNVIDITISFVLSPLATTSTNAMLTTVNTQSSVLTSALNLQGTMLGNTFNSIGGLISTTENAASSVISTVAGYANIVGSAVNDVNRSIGSVLGIAASIDPSLTTGRYGLGNIIPGNVISGLSGLTSDAARITAATSIVMNDATNARAGVLATVSTMSSLAAAI